MVLLSLVAFLGLCNSIAFSTAYQIVTHFQTSNSVALTLGEPLVPFGLMVSHAVLTTISGLQTGNPVQAL